MFRASIKLYIEFLSIDHEGSCTNLCKTLKKRKTISDKRIGQESLRPKENEQCWCKFLEVSVSVYVVCNSSILKLNDGDGDNSDNFFIDSKFFHSVAELFRLNSILFLSLYFFLFCFYNSFQPHCTFSIINCGESEVKNCARLEVALAFKVLATQTIHAQKLFRVYRNGKSESCA